MMTESGVIPPQLRRWSRDEYLRMADEGFFEGQRVELVEGMVVERTAMNSTLEVRRAPEPDVTRPSGYGYADLQLLPASGIVFPLLRPGVEIHVADLLPPRS